MIEVIGIDPSLTATGIANVDGSLETVKTKPKDKDHRLGVIYSEVSTACERGEYRLFAVIEDLPKHAMAAGITGMVQGVVRLALIEWEVEYVTIPPATLKKFATDKGNADKAFMRAKWLEYTGIDNPDDNQVDAAFLREIGLVLTGQPSVVPTDHHAALAGYRRQVS